MSQKDPYQIIVSRRVTEKAKMLENLQNSNSHPSLSRCKAPKYVFNVDKRATKQEIAYAVQEIYAEKNVHVVAVNTVRIQSKPRRVRGHRGSTPSGKKAIVTLRPGETLDETV